MTRIEGLLKTRARIITLVGPAGVGKTRLSVELARAHPHVIATLELGGARSLDDLCRLLGQALSVDLSDVADAAVAERIGDALEARAGALGSSLIVLDEFERLVSLCAAAVESWATRTTSVRFLITSRVALSVASETVYELRPLQLPVAGEQPQASPAIRLFLDRLPRSRADTPLDSRELQDVAAIVECVEGVPLAIELAASSLEAQSTSELLASLRQTIAAESVADTSSEGRRSLRGAIRSAWDALDEAERDALVACAVFRGGFTADSLGAVLSIEVSAARTRMDRLRARALLFSVEVHAGESPRLDVYDSVRRHVLGVVDPNRNAAYRRAHSEYFLRHLCDGRLFASTHAVAPPTLEAEQENLSAVLEGALSEGTTGAAASAALQVVVALAPLRIGRAPLGDYLRQLDAALAASERAQLDPSLQVLALIARGRVQGLAGRLTLALADHERALGLAEQRCSDELIAQALVKLAVVRRNLGDFEIALRLFRRALALAKSTGQPRVEAEAAGGLARVVRDTGATPEEALALAEQSAGLARQSGDLATAARMESRLGTLLVDVGRYEDAALRFEAAQRLAAEIGLSHVDAVVTLNVALMTHDRGELSEADSLYRRAIERARELGLGRLLGGALVLRGFLLLAEDRVPEAAESFTLALLAFQGGSEAPYAGLTHVALGATHALRDRIVEAEESEGVGRAILERGGVASLLVAADVLGAHLDLARGRAALARGDLSEARRAQHAASARVANAKQSQPGVRSSAAAAAIVRVALMAVQPALARASSEALPVTIARDGSFVDLPTGAHVDLRTQPLSRRILALLVTARRETPGVPVLRDALVRAIWPEEDLPRTVGKNRLHVAMNQLRSLGLRDLVLSQAGGFLLDPQVPLFEIEGR